MKDKNTQYPGRKKLTIISQSSSEIVADVERYEGTVTEAGTPLNKANILPDTTAESLGLDPEADPTPADALQAIAQALMVPLDIQELYKPLIAPLSVSLTGFVAGSYLLYGEFYDDLRVFVKVSKTTAMSGATPIGTLPSGYRPTTTRNLTAYDTDGNIIADVIVQISPTGGVSVVGDVDANVIVMAAYNSGNSQSVGGLTYKDIDRLISQNGAVIATNASYPAFDSGARWIKYADGTAEIDIQKTGTFAMTTNTGAGYYTQNADLTITMPITLVNVDIFLCYIFGGWGMFVQGYVAGFPTELRYRVYRSTSSTVAGTVHFTIKGRWK